MDDFDWYTTNKYQAYKPPQQETPILLEPDADQLAQIIIGLRHCHTYETKSEFLRVWICDWTEHKLKEKNT